MAEETGDELTPGEKQLEKELAVAHMAYEECRRQWVDHYYAGQDPGSAQSYHDATVIRSRKYSGWDIPEETGIKAEVLVMAVQGFQEALGMAKAEWSYSRDVEELNRALGRLREEGQDS